jgi:hypothetical protein
LIQQNKEAVMNNHSFFFPQIQRKAAMKHITLFIVLMGITCLFSCKSTVETPQKAEKAGKAAMAVPLGWIDANTFRAMATGASRDSAVSSAQLVVIEKFITERVKLSGMDVDLKSTGVAIVNEFGGEVKNGSVIREAPDEGGKMKVIYEVKSENLKNRVQGRKK